MNRTMGSTILVPAILATTLTLSACSDDPGMSGHDMSTAMRSGTTSPGNTADESGGTAAAGARNDADVDFARGMIPHHGQALTMAELALTKASGQPVKDLAAQIQKAQDPEIRQMSGWLRGWGEPVPQAQGMNHGEGMMSMQDMASLEKAEGAEFDRMWLAMMIQHHEGAIATAETELKAGSNPEAKALARAIIDGQSNEITAMNALLARLGG